MPDASPPRPRSLISFMLSPDISHLILSHYSPSNPVNSPLLARFMTTLLTKVDSVPVSGGDLLVPAPEQTALHIPGPRVLSEGEQRLGVVIRPWLLLPPGLLWPWHRGKIYGAWKQNITKTVKLRKRGILGYCITACWLKIDDWFWFWAYASQN